MYQCLTMENNQMRHSPYKRSYLINDNSQSALLALTWIEGLLRCPRLDAVWHGSWPSIMVLWVDQRECIDHHLPFNTLNWVHHHCYSPLIQSFKTLQAVTDFNNR
ncbi:hypothetical protein J1N35_013995 [Gossypium stocksii]|uniref:Uncharacterized protein n=1 Tax=Gossypium stocksii TaxID=47602 RepID=A0A9D3VV17_9ROSI|nr:hypothetical protein J1N35_013995 [Gossypium stocksii]